MPMHPEPVRTSPGSARLDGPSGRLRYEQVAAVSGRTGMMAFGSILTFLIIMWTFWPVAPHRYLLGVLALLAVMHGLALLGSRTWLSRGPHAVPRWVVAIWVAVASLLAVAWSTIPFVLMPHASADQRQLLIYIFAGFSSSSILMAPLLPAALSFVAITTIGILASMPFADQSVTVQHAILIMLYFLMTCGVLLHQNRDFARRVTNELTLAEQGDIIGLLLRDFEENASDWLWQTDTVLCLQRVSGRLATLLGCDAQDLQDVPVRRLIAENHLIPAGEKHDGDKLSTCLSHREAFRDLQVLVTFGATTRWFSLTGKPVLDAAGRFTGYRGVGSDITAARKSDERIAYLARYDSLTGLPNRTLFQEALDQACATSVPFALMCLDLDGFKSVNDTLGHATGDALLMAVAGRMRGCLREGDVVGRLGGDEFAVLQIRGDARTAGALARRLVEHIAEPYRIDDVPASVGLSIGIALSDGAPADAQALLHGADLALYQSKAEGRGTWHFFEPAMAARAQIRHAMQADLRRAIDGDELLLEFQPILDIVSGEITGAEALVRWLHPRKGRIAPNDFIPIAEESGLILPLGAWVLQRACREAASWEGEARVAVNLSPLQFRDPHLLELVDAALASSGLSPHRLELEITESVFLDAADRTVACLEALRSRGIHIALDDFGTGYSSLSYLRSFPFDKVKIDQSFIRDLSVNDDAIAIVQAIVGMASSLGMYTTGEGVETASQARLLQLTGCSQVQGYLFGRPCSADAIAGIMGGDRPKLAELLGPPAATPTADHVGRLAMEAERLAGARDTRRRRSGGRLAEEAVAAS